MKNKLKMILENEGSDDPVKVGQYKKIGKLSLTSADDQIDAYLLNMQFGAVQNKKEEEEIDAEPEATESEEESTLSESLSQFSLRALLKEEGEVIDSSSIDIEDPASLETVAINVSTFAKHVKEFVNMAHERLDIPSVIVNRARNLIKDKHPDAIKAFDRALEGVNLGGESRFKDEPDDSFQSGAMGGGA